MTIERNLRWRQFAENFNDESKRILLGLSSKKWLWRTFENLQAVTNLDYDALNHALAELIEEGLVKGSINRRTGSPIFGLSERVGSSNIGAHRNRSFGKINNRNKV